MDAFLVWLGIAVLLPIILFYVSHGKPRSVAVGSPSSAKEGAPRRNIQTSSSLKDRPSKDISTLYDILVRGTRLHPRKNILGARRLIRTVEEEKEVVKTVAGVETKEIKKWTFSELSEYEWWNYLTLSEKCRDYGAGFKALGLKPQDKITLFAATSRDWLTIAFSAFTQSFLITTAYDTLGEEGLSFSLQEGEVTTLFTNASLLSIMGKVAARVPTLKNIVFNGSAKTEVVDALKKAGLNVLNLDELEALGQSHPADPVPPKPEDLACIMYTSGSTGNPKGVMLTHANIVAAVAGVQHILTQHMTTNETYLAYLPLAHILEFSVECSAIYLGISMGYGSVRTLTDASVRNCKGDLRELRPTVMAGVPAVWETIRKGVSTKLRDASPLVQNIFTWAVELKWLLIQYGLPTRFLDSLVFSKIKDQTGGRLRLALSGGAPIPKSTQKFFNCAVCTLVSGYGMTECCAVLAVQDPAQPGVLGMVGPPTACAEIKLVDVPDSSYKSTNVPRPQGEIWMRGPTVMKGYYKQPKTTAESLTEDGWLMTGDIGEWTSDGNLAVIDRKKNLVKLSNGEYIALEKLEAIYKTSPYVQNICVYGDSEQSFCLAIVQPVEKEIHHFVKSINLVPDSHAEDFGALVRRPEVVRAVLESLRGVGKGAGLKPAEIVGGCFVASEEWTPINGFLTAAMKLKRKDVVDFYKPHINKLYGKK
jgi:long-chain acyl-CoA synthetase